MKIILATGIYPPTLGGPATYVKALAEELVKKGVEVVVVTYNERTKNQEPRTKENWKVVGVSKGLPLLRWLSYAHALRKQAADADIVYAFSSVSVGVPVMLANLKCKKVLRLGGDFFWDRYTGRGGRKGLKEWYKGFRLSKPFLARILKKFDHIVFSSKFQEEIYKENYKLPEHSVIENAMPTSWQWREHIKREPFRMLTMCRFVRVKNLSSLIKAVSLVPEVFLTIVGDGPTKSSLQSLVKSLKLEGRVAFVSPITGKDKQAIFDIHELLVMPSFSEVSPNSALEATSAGLPVLLTKENGFSKSLIKGMILKDLKTPEEIANAIKEIYDNYQKVEQTMLPERSWEVVANETLTIFKSL